MEIIASIVFLFTCLLILFIAYKVQINLNKQYFKGLNDCLYDALKRALKESID